MMPMLALVGQLGMTMVLSIVLGVLLGLWIDGRLGTKPFGILIFSLIGIITGSVAVYRLISSSLDQVEGPAKAPRKVATGDSPRETIEEDDFQPDHRD